MGNNTKVIVVGGDAALQKQVARKGIFEQMQDRTVLGRHGTMTSREDAGQIHLQDEIDTTDILDPDAWRDNLKM